MSNLRSFTAVLPYIEAEIIPQNTHRSLLTDTPGKLAETIVASGTTLCLGGGSYSLRTAIFHIRRMVAMIRRPTLLHSQYGDHAGNNRRDLLTGVYVEIGAPVG